MAEYIIKELKEGYDSSSQTPTKCIVLTRIVFDPEDEVLIIPSHDPVSNEPLTHVGYYQYFEEAHEHWVDWHHPSKGCDFIPDSYKLFGTDLKIPSHIKKVVIPETVTDISCNAFENVKKAIFEVHPENPKYTVENNCIVWKR